MKGTRCPAINRLHVPGDGISCLGKNCRGREKTVSPHAGAAEHHSAVTREPWQVNELPAPDSDWPQGPAPGCAVPDQALSGTSMA